MTDEQFNEFLELLKLEDFVEGKGVLLIKEKGDLISGKITTNLFPNEGMDFPPLKKTLAEQQKRR